MKFKYLAITLALSCAVPPSLGQAQIKAGYVVPLSNLANRVTTATSDSVMSGLKIETRTAEKAGRPAAATTPTDINEQKMATAEAVVANLHLYNIIVYAGEITLLEHPVLNGYTAEQKDNLRKLLNKNLLARREKIIHEVAVESVGTYSQDQLNVILALAQVGYVQDSVMAGANPALPPDERTVTTSDRTLLNTYLNETYVGSYLQNLSVGPAGNDVKESVEAAFATFLANPDGGDTTAQKP